MNIACPIKVSLYYKGSINMNIKKGIRLIALGFLFTLVNVNLTSGNTKINITPDFIGWIMIFFGCGMLGDYVKGKPWYKWGAFLLAILSAALWVTELIDFNLNFDVKYLEIGTTVATTLYILLILGLLQKIGKDYGSALTGNLGVLKIVYLVVYILFQAVSLFIDTLPLEVLSIILTIAGGAALVTAIITCIILFRMSIEIE